MTLTSAVQRTQLQHREVTARVNSALGSAQACPPLPRAVQTAVCQWLAGACTPRQLPGDADRLALEPASLLGWSLPALHSGASERNWFIPTVTILRAKCPGCAKSYKPAISRLGLCALVVFTV